MSNPKLRLRIENELAERQRQLSLEDSELLTEIDAEMAEIQGSAIKLMGDDNRDRESQASAVTLVHRVTLARSILRKYAEERALGKATGYFPSDLGQQWSTLSRRNRNQINRFAVAGSQLIWRQPAPEIPTSKEGFQDLVVYKGASIAAAEQLQSANGKNIAIRGPFRAFTLKGSTVECEDTKELWNTFEEASADLAQVITGGFYQDLFEVQTRFAMNLIEDESAVHLLDISSVTEATDILADAGREAISKIDGGEVQSWEALSEGAEAATRAAFTVREHARTNAAIDAIDKNVAMNSNRISGPEL